MNDAHVGRNSTQQNNATVAQAAVIQETTPFDLLRSAHNLLIGRYRLALPIALLLAALGAMVAYTALKPTYASSAVVQVSPTSPGTTFEDENSVTPRYESFVAAQATLIASRAVIDRAIQDQGLIQAGWPSGQGGLRQLAEALQVQHKSGAQTINVMVTADTPEKAQAATTAILATYQDIYGERNGVSMGVQESFLDARVSQIQNDIKSINASIDEIVFPFGGYDALRSLHDSKLSSITKLDERMTDLAIQQTNTELKASPNQQGIEMLARIAAGGASVGLSPAQASIQKLIREDAELQLKIDALRARGYGGRHPQVRTLTNAREQINEAAEHREMLITEIINSLGVPLVNPDGSIVEAPEAYVKLSEELRKLRERMSTEVVGMGNAIGKVQRLQSELETAQTRLARATDQLQIVKIQANDHSLGRVSIPQHASYPAWAASDRRTAASSVAAIVMFIFGIAGVMAYGYFRPDISSIRDLQIMSLPSPLVGVFVDPEKRNIDRDPLSAVAAHELRNTLFSGAGHTGTRVFAVTEAGESGGQTGVASSLAQSFAMAGYQTLLVDGDLASAQLSAKYNMGGQTAGLRDLLSSGDPKGTVHRTAKPRLWIMPTGTNKDVTPDTLSADDVALFVQMAKNHYDVIVIDAGSATRNLESVLFTGVSDRSVLTVRIDESRRIVTDALDRVERSGEPVAGIVLTNADYQDAKRSGMICDRDTAESLYPEGLARVGRDAPLASETVAGNVDETYESDEQTAAA